MCKSVDNFCASEMMLHTFTSWLVAYSMLGSRIWLECAALYALMGSFLAQLGISIAL